MSIGNAILSPSTRGGCVNFCNDLKCTNYMLTTLRFIASLFSFFGGDLGHNCLKLVYTVIITLIGKCSCNFLSNGTYIVAVTCFTVVITNCRFGETRHLRRLVQE